jgi:hypothetical protein
MMNETLECIVHVFMEVEATRVSAECTNTLKTVEKNLSDMHISTASHKEESHMVRWCKTIKTIVSATI